jgi:hypothetical protein
MQTTKERLEQLLEEQTKQKEINIANANVNAGAIFVLQQLIAEENNLEVEKKD